MGTFRSLTNQGPLIDSTSVAGTVLATSTGNVTLITSAATAIYVYAYDVVAASTATLAVRLMSGSTNEVWRTGFGAGGSTVGMQIDRDALAVTPPAYLFRCVPGDALTYEKGGSSAAGAITYSLAYWRQ